jgi:hypothetical protein
MNAKLTLNLNKTIIEEANWYAKRHRISLSKMIENYLSSLAKPSSANIKISPLVENLTGVIPQNENTDERSDYRNYLIEKYE